MPEYLSPGVYVEEVPSTIKPIVGVSTSTAAFVGIVPDQIQIPEENPEYDPTKPLGDNNKNFVTWTFPYPQADYDNAKNAYDAAAAPNVRPARPKDDKPESLKAFRDAREKFSRKWRDRSLLRTAPTRCTPRQHYRTGTAGVKQDRARNILAFIAY